MKIPTINILIGLPGSGKSRYAETLSSNENIEWLSSDGIREELFGDASIQDNPDQVFTLMKNRALEALSIGKDVIYDATNITRKSRASIINALPRYVKLIATVVWADIETCIERDKSRDRVVGREVIDKMLKRFQAPYYDEGFDEIKIIYNNNEDFSSNKYVTSCLQAMKIPHDNKHHTLNIYEHSMAALKYLEDKGYDAWNSIYWAAKYHDVGKPYVKKFINSKGEATEEAHYYSHQCVGAWMSYGIFNDLVFYFNVEIAWLISSHMDPYLNTKYYKNMPKVFKNKVDLLHEADRNAH